MSIVTSKDLCDIKPPETSANANTFDGFVKHFYPRQVVSFRLSESDKPMKATIRKVHIDDKDKISYDIEVWSMNHCILKDIDAEFVFIEKI